MRPKLEAKLIKPKPPKPKVPEKEAKKGLLQKVKSVFSSK